MGAMRALCSFALCAAFANSAWGQSAEAPEPANEAAPDPATLLARRHFQKGLRLYRDTNYSGALAEFEAAYREKPGPGSLQNVALSLKALFRYAETSQTLRLLLERHGHELSEGERTAVRDAIAELEALVGLLRVKVTPASATVSVNGRELGAIERAHGVTLNVGEHVIVAEMLGYARRSQIVRVAGQKVLELELELEPTAGFLRIETGDAQAAIAVDGQPRGFASWSGPVAPEAEHLIQVYREGFEPFERVVRVGRGQTLRIEGKLGERTSRPGMMIPPSDPERPVAPPPPRAATGVYGLVALGVLGLNDAPLDLRISEASEGSSLASVGLRAGYRLSEPIAVELAFDAGRLDGTDACQVSSENEKGCSAERDFTLTSLRFGPNLRLFTRGETLRFAVGLGAGAVAHRVELEAATAVDGSRLTGGETKGVDPYFSFEIGAAFNYRHLLAELSLMAVVEGADHLSGEFDEGEQGSVFADGTLPMLGLGLKLGYSAWAPRR